MFDLSGLIGLEINLAKDKLKKAGFNDVSVVLNAEHCDKCDTILVCAARENEGSITLICGEFLMNLKG